MTPTEPVPQHALPPEAEDLHCPVCDYALRGLPEPRCPECGYAFEWEELREQARRRQLWFYEHAGTFRSHLRTRWRSLRPWSFWSQIHAYSDADTRRLWRYRVVTFVLLIVAGVCAVTLPMGRQALGGWVARHGSTGRVVTSFTPPNVPYTVRTFTQVVPSMRYPRYNRPGPNGSGMQQVMPTPTTRTVYQYYVPPSIWVRWLAPLAYQSWWPLDLRPVLWAIILTAGITLGLPLYWRLLRGSVLQANIRPVHLARVDAYSTDAMPFLLLAYVVFLLFSPPIRSGYSNPFGFSNAVNVLAAPTLIVGGLTLRLASALRRYVRFPQAFFVALAYGVIASLTWVIVLLQAIYPF